MKKNRVVLRSHSSGWNHIHNFILSTEKKVVGVGCWVGGVVVVTHSLRFIIMELLLCETTGSTQQTGYHNEPTNDLMKNNRKYQTFSAQFILFLE